MNLEELAQRDTLLGHFWVSAEVFGLEGVFGEESTPVRLEAEYVPVEVRNLP